MVTKQPQLILYSFKSLQPTRNATDTRRKNHVLICDPLGPKSIFCVSC